MVSPSITRTTMLSGCWHAPRVPPSTLQCLHREQVVQAGHGVRPTHFLGGSARGRNRERASRLAVIIFGLLPRQLCYSYGYRSNRSAIRLYGGHPCGLSSRLLASGAPPGQSRLGWRPRWIGRVLWPCLVFYEQTEYGRGRLTSSTVPTQLEVVVEVPPPGIGCYFLEGDATTDKP
jgi:hypothetical protein